MENEIIEKQNSTEVLMGVLEDFGRAEADRVLVVYLNAAGEVCIRHNTDYIEMAGMAAYVTARVTMKMMGIKE